MKVHALTQAGWTLLLFILAGNTERGPGVFDPVMILSAFTLAMFGIVAQMLRETRRRVQRATKVP